MLLEKCHPGVPGIAIEWVKGNLERIKMITEHSIWSLLNECPGSALPVK